MVILYHDRFSQVQDIFPVPNQNELRFGRRSVASVMRLSSQWLSIGGERERVSFFVSAVIWRALRLGDAAAFMVRVIRTRFGGVG
ncbi:MAG: hypothetical protein AB7U97_15445 [Pirellulales bacterium]